MTKQKHATYLNRGDALKAGLGGILKWILLIYFALYTLFPLIWLFISSFKTNTELFADPFSLPAVWQISNYINALKVSGLIKMMGNSILIGGLSTVLNVLCASMLAYCLSRFRFRGRKNGLLFMILLQMFPAAMSMVAIITTRRRAR